MIARVCISLWLCCCALAYGDEIPRELLNVPDSQVRVDEIDGLLRAQFDATLRDYDAPLARHPYDVVASLQRCRFITEFADTYEFASFTDGLYAQSESCFATLHERWPEHPEVLLGELERSDDEDKLDRALQVLAESNAHRWTDGQLARLHATLAAAAWASGDARGFEFARVALQLDEGTDVRIQLATEWVKRGNIEEVVRVLTSPAERHDANDVWHLAKKMRLLADVGAHDAVVDIYSTLRQHETFDAVDAARALRKVGAIEHARDALTRLSEDQARALRGARERFRFELEYGSAEAALAAYENWRESGWQADPLAINRAALLWRAPALPLQVRDLAGVGLLLAAIAAVGIAAAVPVGFVHYRGLVRRARTESPYPREGWQLRHAWLALFAFSVGSIFALYSAGPLDLNAGGGRLWGMDASAEQIARMAMIGEFIALALLMPLAVTARRMLPQDWSSEWSWLTSIAAGALLAVALRLRLVLAAMMSEGDVGSGATQQLLWQVLDSIRDTYGIASALWLVVIAAPVIEEFVFRGVLLRAFAAHLRFGWANLVQAVIFAAIHFDLRAAPMLFVFGLCAGFLARRCGGLLAPIVLHFVFNLIGASLVLL